MTKKKKSVFIATSLDGYIADRDGGIKWLEAFPEINNIDTGYKGFIARIDAIVMGRSTYETVIGFGIAWPYQKPVYVLSNSLTELPAELTGKVFLVKGSLTEILEEINLLGHTRLYIDGGRLIQSCLKEDLIDEMIITIIPVILGGGIPLFKEQPDMLAFTCRETKLFLDAIVQNHFIRKNKLDYHK